MQGAIGISSRLRLAGVSVLALAAITSPALAGGFDIHEQSTVFLGSAMAGAAAGGSLGSMYWNSAGAAQFSGLNTESSYTLVLPEGNVHVRDTTPGAVFGLSDYPVEGVPSSSGNIGIDAVTSASYGAYQVSRDLWLGIAINSPFGLATKPDNTNYSGAILGVTTKLLTVNANPMISYRIAPGITIGAGVQMEYGWGKLQFVTPSAVGGDTAQFKGDDWAFGGTAGIMIEPAAGTSIGLGYRSQLTHELDGHFHSDGIGNGSAVGTVNLPDIVTFSARQVVAPNMRLLGSIQWENWSRFDQLTVRGNVPGGELSIPANWDDSWYFSVGAEYDYSPALTLRTGVGYEISPVDDPTKRFTSIPDNDKVYLSIGASYRYSEATTFDVGYSHLFVQDGDFVRAAPLGGPTLQGTVDASIDLISVGMRTRW
jgi:long-chain fatty acid transport protein